MKLHRSDYGNIQNQLIEKISITNLQDSTIEIINYGATIISWVAKDKSGNLKEILLGRDNLQGYIDDHPNFGCTIGRFANRIHKGAFELDGKKIQLSRNLDGHHLHGGWEGFGKKVWTIAEVQANQDHCQVKMSYTSPDGEEGYPGNLIVEITFIFTNESEIIMIHKGKSDKNTICNLTNHCYFNLGYGNSISDHYLTINSEEITEVQPDLIPTGRILNIQNTPFDFRKSILIDVKNVAMHPILEYGKGYDVNYVLHHRKDYKTEAAAELYHADSGLQLSVFTSKPGLQLYTGNWLEGVIGRNKQIYKQYSGICLEAQDFPDSPNHPSFPSVILSKNEEYFHFIKYKITTLDI